MADYPAQALHDQFPRGRKGGVFHVSPDGLIFDGGDLRISIPLEGLRIETGGSGNRLTYFRSPALPGHAFYTSEKGILRDPFFLQNAELTSTATRARSSHRKGGLGFVLALASFVAVGDLTAQAVRATSIAYEPFLYLLTAGALYLTLSGLLAILQVWAERRFRIGVTRPVRTSIGAP